MAFVRKEVVEFALDGATRRAVEEQQGLIAAEPRNPRGYHQLGLLYRMQGKRDEALGLLLEAVRVDAAFAPGHAALVEMYAAGNDMGAARRHAERAAELGDSRARDMLARYESV